MRRPPVGVLHLSSPGAATNLHYIPEDEAIWLDPVFDVREGLVIGVGRTRFEAITDALQELRARIADLERALHPEDPMNEAHEGAVEQDGQQQETKADATGDSRELVEEQPAAPEDGAAAE